MLNVHHDVDPRHLKEIIAHLIAHHDALRMRYHNIAGNWQQVNAASEKEVPFSLIDLSRLSHATQTATIEQIADRVQTTLNLQHGPLLRVAFFDLGGGQMARLLLVIHHLVVDGISWRILLEDLQTAHEQLTHGASIHLPAKTTPFQDWSKKLGDYAQSAYIRQQLAYWHKQAIQIAQGSVPLPIDHQIGENTIAASHTFIVSLDQEETDALLHEVPRAYHTQINDILLTALAQTLTNWTGQSKHLVDLEGHGREDILEQVDISRTVGWFTSLFPVMLDVGTHTRPGDMLKYIKEQLRAIPQHGIGYGLLCYLCTSASLENSEREMLDRLHALPAAQISFNYLGQFDQIVEQNSFFEPSTESSGLSVNPLTYRPHLLDINANISAGQLQIAWTYSEHYHAASTIESIALDYKNSIQQLIAHCLQPDAGGATPSDFPLAALSQAQIDTLLGHPAQVDAVYPLSPLQEGMLFHSLYAPEDGDYITQVHFTFQGPLNLTAFRAAWQSVIQQHEILRTDFLWEGLDSFHQVVRSQVSLPFLFDDWRSSSPTAQQELLLTYLHTDRLQGFVLSQAPLLRLALFQLDEDRYAFIWSHHHLLLDGWSLPLVLRDLFACYDAFCQGHTPSLGHVQPYQAYIAWLKRQDLALAEVFWRERLQGFRHPTSFGITLTPHAVTHQYQEHALSLPDALTQRLHQFVRAQHLTLNTLFQAAWALVLSRYSGQDDVVFGTTVSGRSAPLADIEAMVGLFINTLPVRLQLQPDDTVLSWLQAVQAMHSEMRQFESSPLSQIQNWSEIPHGTSLFESLFVFENLPVSTPSTTAENTLQVEALKITEQTNYPLTLIALPGQHLSLKVIYDQQHFALPQIERLLTHMQTVLHHLITHPQHALYEVPLLTTTELHLLQQWSMTPTNYPQTVSLADHFEAQVRLAPDCIALTFLDEQLTYAHLNERANQLAHYLLTHGVGPDTLVALCFERSALMIISLLAILKAGGAYVPLDPSYPQERLRFLLHDTAAPVLLTLTPLLDRFVDAPVSCLCLDTLWPVVTSFPTSNPPCTVGPDHLAYVMYTSGSTGTPKGVCAVQRAVLRLVKETNYVQITDQDVFLQLAPLAFDASTFEIWGALLNGARLVLFPPEPPTLAELALLLHERLVSVLWLTAGLFHQMVAHHLADLASLRLLLAGGDVLAVAAVEQVLQQTTLCLINGYGPTENTTFTCCYPMTDLHQIASTVPIGRPIANTSVYLLDQHLQPVPVGIPAELYTGGAGLARGYWQQAELTAEKFLPDPFSDQPGARMYATGDLARYRSDGSIEFLGRRDLQVKIRGYRIEVSEIERVLDQHPAVLQSVVIAHEDHNGTRRLVAYLVGPEPSALEPMNLRAYLQQRVPEYMIPALFVPLDTLPLTSNGKVNRRALPDPNHAHPIRPGELVAPRTTNEQTLVAIWSQVLGIETVSIHDNFFALGGDSILSIQIVARAHQAGLQLTPRQLFQYQTIAELAHVVDTVAPINAHQGMVSGDVPLTPIQHWFFEQDQPQPQHWNQAMVLTARQPIAAQTLRQAIMHLLRQHDALRLRFKHTDQGWQQDHAPYEGSIPFTSVELSHLSPIHQTQAIEQIAAQVQASLDLQAGPLLRTVLFKLGETQQDRILLVAHHLVIDGISWRILLEDVQTAYTQLSLGQTVQLPAKTTSFQQWAQHLVAYAQSDEVRQQLHYWQTLALNTFSRLPVDQIQGENTVASAHSIMVSLSPQETDMLLHKVPSVYHTQVNDVLLTALALLLNNWTGQGSHLIHLEGHGREDLFADIDLSRTVGWFTSLYPVLLDIDSHTQPGQAIKIIKEYLRHIPQKGIGYGLLRYLSKDQEVATYVDMLPEAEISFNYLGQFDQVADSASLFSLATESYGSTMSPLGYRQHLLDINGSVNEGKLNLSWTYSQNFYDEATIKKLAQSYVQILRELIDHCLQPDAGGFTPSDFPLATLTQGQIDALVRQQTQIEAIYPLSPLQQGLLFHSLYAPQGGDHIVQVGYTLRGQVDVTALLRAWQQVIEQYSILRTGFVWEQLDTPLQVVHEHATMPFTTHDWRSLSPLLHDEHLLAFLHKDRREGFVLSHAPLMRIHLIQMADDSFELIWTHHHLLLDGWSFPLLLKEVFACYAAFCEGHTHQVKQVRPYQDYIAWVLQQDVQLAESFWRRCLHGLTQPTMLQVPTPIHPEPGYGELILHTSAELSTTLARFARQQHLTLNTLFQAAWALLLHHYSGQLDVLFGTIVSGRPAALQGVERMIGLFINTVPVRVHVDPALAVLPWLHHIQETHSELRQFEYSPLVQVHNWSELPRGEALFESLLIFENYPLTPQESLQDAPTRLTIQAAHTQEQTTYPLSLYVVPGDPIAFKVLFDRRRFSQTTISRLLEHLQQLLATLVAHPAQSLATIQTLSHEEQHTLLHTFNATHLPVPQEHCIHHLFEQQAVLTPQAIALRSDHDVLSYAQLNERANQLAHYLHAHGVGPNVLVGVCISRSPDMLVALLAILKAGGAYVPLDPAYPAERLAFLLTDAHVALLLTQEHLLTLLPAVQVPRLCLDRDWSVLADLPRDHAPRSTVSSHDLAYVIYTSGSTGTPKGVCIHHRNTVTLLYWAREQFDAQCLQGMLASTSICFDLSVFELFVPLSWGGTVILAENALALPTLPIAEHVRLINTVPSAMAELVRSGSVPASVRVVNLAGEALQRSLVHDLFALPHIQRVCNLYGPTEDTTYSTWADLAAQDDGVVPIGRPIANTQVYLLDAHLQLVPIGVTGELYLGGAGIAQGYLHRPELTAERFIAHPFSDEPGARLYRTGDLARYRDDGTLDYLGRRDQQVKIRGYRIEVGEIESVLLQHPTVQDAVVVAHEENPTQYRLIAYIVSATETLFSDAQLRAYVQERLPSYMLPSLFVPLEMLPLTPNGKVDRTALVRTHRSQTNAQHEVVLARTQTEQRLADIWSQVLGVEQIGIHDNFFALGGDSILSIQIVSRAHQAGLTITPKQLFQAPTIAELATMLSDDTNTPEIVAQQGLVVGAVPLTPIQHWFFAQHQPARQHWNQAVLLRVTQPLNASVLRQTLTHLLIQHDALRFRFSNPQQGWQQDSRVPDEQVPLHLFDLSTLTAMQQTQALEQLANDVQASLDIEHGPLMRVASFHLGSQAQDRLLIVVHHLAIDAVSWRILLEDLQQVYEQLSLEQRAQLPAKTTSFQQWSQLLLDHAQSATVLQQLPYWLTQTLARHHALPVDHYSGANTAASARHVVISLSLQETASLLHEVPAAYHTQINDVLLTALALALSQWTGQRTYVIDLEGHGREDLFAQVDLSRTIGWFTTLFPVLLDLSDVGTSPGTALKTIKERLRHIPQHGIGYGLLRYLSSLASGTEEQEALIQLRTRPAADLSFNYLGQFDQIQQNTTLLRAAPESSGSVVSPHSIRTHLVDINGSISGGQLNLIWTYSVHRHRAETIEALAQNYLRALRELIAHCLQPDAGGFTPSDFPLATLTQGQIDALLSQRTQIEAIYPLSPLQQGFLFHSLYTPNNGDYIIQVHGTFRGELQVAAFEKAWQQVIDRHTILRTNFVWEALDIPLQIVHRQVPVPFIYQDWRSFPDREQDARLAAYLQEDRMRDFDLTQAPLLRITILQTYDDSYELIWSHHHLLLDGWSLPLVIKEVFACYTSLCEKRPLSLEYVRPYQDYIAWLSRQDLTQAEAFWRSTLSGFTAPTPLGIERNTDAHHRHRHLAMMSRTCNSLSH